MGFYFLFGCIAGLAIGAIVSRGLTAEQCAVVPGVIAVLCLPVGFIAILFSLLNSTAPSFAPRISVTGKASDCVRLGAGRDYTRSFRFEPENGKLLQIGTKIVVPPMCWQTLDYEAGSTYHITFLDDAKRYPANEAIDIEVLTGRNVGWRKKLDARPFGFWLATPAGAMLMYLGLYFTRNTKGNAKSAGPQAPSA
jgi:hypothetical protein